MHPPSHHQSHRRSLPLHLHADYHAWQVSLSSNLPGCDKERRKGDHDLVCKCAPCWQSKIRYTANVSILCTTQTRGKPQKTLLYRNEMEIDHLEHSLFRVRNHHCSIGFQLPMFGLGKPLGNLQSDSKRKCITSLSGRPQGRKMETRAPTLLDSQSVTILKGILKIVKDELDHV